MIRLFIIRTGFFFPCIFLEITTPKTPTYELTIFSQAKTQWYQFPNRTNTQATHNTRCKFDVIRCNK